MLNEDNIMSTCKDKENPYKLVLNKLDSAAKQLGITCTTCGGILSQDWSDLDSPMYCKKCEPICKELIKPPLAWNMKLKKIVEVLGTLNDGRVVIRYNDGPYAYKKAIEDSDLRHRDM
jgi:hypothetical protein